MRPDIRGALLGIVFGDGYIQVRNRLNGTTHYIQSELRIVHSIKQYDLCEHKACLIRKHLGGKFQVKKFTHAPPSFNGKKYEMCGFTVSNTYFRTLKKWCYPEGKKLFTERTLNMLTDEGIALWYMDDGHHRINTNVEGNISSVSTEIATMCSFGEAELIKSYFMDIHGVDFSIAHDKRRSKDKEYFIRANTEQSRKFVSIVLPYIIPSMQYKVQHVADLDSHEHRAPYCMCSCGSPVYDNRRGGLCPTCYSRKYYRTVLRFRQGRKPSPRGFYKGGDIVQTHENENHEKVADKELS